MNRKFNFDPPSCTCGYIKSVGLPCRHLINFSLRIQLQELLNDFMLERWLGRSSPNEICPDIQPSPYVIESIPEVIPVSSTLTEYCREEFEKFTTFLTPKKCRNWPVFGCNWPIFRVKKVVLVFVTIVTLRQ